MRLTNSHDPDPAPLSPQLSDTVTCPACSKPLSLDLASPAATPGVRTSQYRKNSILSRFDTAHFQSSTKIEALREEIHRWKS